MKYRIQIATTSTSADVAQPWVLAVVEGTESDATRLRGFLHGSPVMSVKGDKTDLIWDISAEAVMVSKTYHPVAFNARGDIV